MADNGSHTNFSVGVTVWLYGLLADWSTTKLTLCVAIVNFFFHFPLDALPHGHMEDRKKEILISAAISLLSAPFLVSCLFNNRYLLYLCLIGSFFGNLFDAFMIVAEKIIKKEESKLARFILDTNLFVHWFVRKQTWLDKQCLVRRGEKMAGTWKGEPVRGFAFGWYNFIPVILSGLFLLSISYR